jgi:ribulose 1,5-bisphosphate synthetase/thiazole synthase
MAAAASGWSRPQELERPYMRHRHCHSKTGSGPIFGCMITAGLKAAGLQMAARS